MKISHLDHLVLTVKDITATVEFYSKILDMEAVYFAKDRVALSFGHQKINLHQSGNEFEPKAQHVQSGSADLCFITDTPIIDVKTHIEQQGVTVFEGPVQRTGAIGNIISVYFRDLDGNLIEVSNYL
ncbi:VOC family protein [Aliivibrio logei]|uniref:Glyoxalase n=2 Tax=Aliivibrio logei TaxID=688 RepID=A0A1B9P0G0_ALILO|nr:VOC family protein [Aliivibrio logei]OCH21846.1 glyoxalase [Aliivibrio logei]OEF09815.1 glyoxalase [Aliivibrio logei 5S-186]